ncbi:MAG: hypothetical protein HFE84_10470 [Lachnospiraceae bacterium]|nr:hypothetical protein [Lachnospiraceae bacterium]
MATKKGMAGVKPVEKKMASAKTVAPAVEVKAESTAEERAENTETAEKTVESKKASKKVPAAKTAPKAIKSSLCVQFAGKEYTEKSLVSAAKKAYVALGNKAADIKTIEVYVKLEDSAAYYAVNGVGSPDYKIEL